MPMIPIRIHSSARSRSHNRTDTSDSNRVGSATVTSRRSSQAASVQPAQQTYRGHYSFNENNRNRVHSDSGSSGEHYEQDRIANDRHNAESYRASPGAGPGAGPAAASGAGIPVADTGCPGGDESGSRRTASYLYNLWIDQKLCDVLMRCAGTGGRSEEKIMAHKVALAAYSDQLEAKFTEFEASEMVSIDMMRFPQDAVIAVVRFAYTNEVELTRDTVGSIWQVADALGIRTIVDLCEEFLGQTTPENAIYHYAVAEKFQLGELSKRIYAFIQSRFLEVSRSVEFQYMPFERLALLLQDDRIVISSELDVYGAMIRWIECDRQKRLCFAAQLLRDAVRLQCITPECLIKHVESVGWLFEAVPECKEIVNEAIRFHALALSQSPMADEYPRQSVRSCVTLKY